MGDQRVDDQRVDHRAPGDRLPGRAEQLGPVPDALLEQVGQAGGAVPEQREGVGLVGVLGQHHHADTRTGGADAVGRLDALHVVAAPHPAAAGGAAGRSPRPTVGAPR
ncbi:MAG TPA: hypothetical protein VF486_05165 [Actinomycetes bacterium]